MGYYNYLQIGYLFDVYTTQQRHSRNDGAVLCTSLLFGLGAQVIVVDETRTLRDLHPEIRHMTAEQKQIAGLHLPCEAHKDRRVQAKSWIIEKIKPEINNTAQLNTSYIFTQCHFSANDLWVLVDVGDASQRYSPIGDGTPEVCAETVCLTFSYHNHYTK